MFLTRKPCNYICSLKTNLQNPESDKIKRSPQLKPCIDFQNGKNKNNFEKNCFMLMNNKALCKKMENLRNTVHVRFPANGKYPKLVSNPSFVPQKHLAKIQRCNS